MVVLCAAVLTANGALAPNFKVYAFLPLNGSDLSQSDVLSHYGILPIDVIYENRYMTNQQIDSDKIKKIALAAVAMPSIPISFDMEFGNRFKPETVIPKIITILRYFRHYNIKSQVGIYATIPQNTYGIKPVDGMYKQLNDQYNLLINWVDYISPSLYNYEKNNFNAWLVNARFIMGIAKKYPLKKPIIPYISPIIRLGPSLEARHGHVVIELSETQMMERLEALYQLGASGCIIWTSSQDRDQMGQKLKFNPRQGWGKAVVTFIQSHGAGAAPG